MVESHGHTPSDEAPLISREAVRERLDVHLASEVGVQQPPHQ